MSRQGTAWSVKGVDQATRDIARRAAQAAGLTIGEWIDQAIRADAETRASMPASASPSKPATAVATVPGQPTPRGPASGPAGAGRVSLATVDLLAQRLDTAEARLDAAMRPIAYALQNVAQRLVTLEARAEAEPSAWALPGAASSVESWHLESADPASADREPADREPADPDPVDARPVRTEPFVAKAMATASLPPAAEPAAEMEPDDEDVIWSEPGAATEPLQGLGGPVIPEIPAVPVTTSARRLPEAPPADWEPAVTIRRAALAREAEALREARRVRAGPPPTAAVDEEVAVAVPADLHDGPRVETVSEARLDADPVWSDPVGADSVTAYPVTAYPVAAYPVAADPVVADPVVADPGGPPARPEPVPPAGDMAVDLGVQVVAEEAADRRDDVATGRREDATVPDWLASRDAVRGPAPAHTAPARSVPFGPGRRRAIAAAATIVLGIAGLGGAWWLATGGGVPTPDSVRDRLADSGAALRQTVAGAADSAMAEFERWTSGPETVAPAEPERQIAARPAVAPVPTPVPTPAPAPVIPPTAEPAPTPVAPAPSPPATDSPAAAPPLSAAAPTAGVAESPRPEQPAPPPREAVIAPAGPDNVAAVPAPAAAPTPAPGRPAVSPPPPGPAATATPPPAPTLTAPPRPAVQAPATGADRLAAVPPSRVEPAAPPIPGDLVARARSGDPGAQHELAGRLASATPPDFAQAANWFREAAIQGVANSQYNLGVLYERGLGVPQDDTRALLWYHSAAEQGHPVAQYNLGVLYSAGRGIPLSYAEAGRWFGRAAERGVPAAAYNLAILTEGGLGVQRDAAEAERLLRRAAELGHPEARRRLAAGGLGAAGASLAETASTVADDGVAEDDVGVIQTELARLGFYEGPIDGLAGPKTRDAIARYQVQQGLPATGLPSSSLRRQLAGS